MAYQRKNWKDHTTTKPHTYREEVNGDGTVTHTPAFGDVVQQGTPQSATNFNAIEEALQHLSVAYDWMFCIMQAQAREITTLQEKVQALS